MDTLKRFGTLELKLFPRDTNLEIHVNGDLKEKATPTFLKKLMTLLQDRDAMRKNTVVTLGDLRFSRVKKSLLVYLSRNNHVSLVAAVKISDCEAMIDAAVAALDNRKK